jgi:hypothetical protein
MLLFEVSPDFSVVEQLAGHYWFFTRAAVPDPDREGLF